MRRYTEEGAIGVAVRKTAVLAGAAVVLAMAGCSSGDREQGASEPASETVAAEPTGPDAQPGISASKARLILPVVAGNPGAVYFTLDNGTSEPVTLAGAYIEGAGETQFHETAEGSMREVEMLMVDAGSQLSLAPGETHIMVYDVSESLAAGGTSELTLTFEDGDKLSIPIAIEARGGAGN